jgi:hypothetical protein
VSSEKFLFKNHHPLQPGVVVFDFVDIVDLSRRILG